MKTAEEAARICDMCDRLCDQVEAAYNRLGIENVYVSITYDNETEMIGVYIEYANHVERRFWVNVNADAVKTAICELVRELIVHISQEFRGE